MIYDEITKRDWYMYRRGELREYIRCHGILSGDVHSELFKWIDTGHDIHDNPWGLRDTKNNLSYDYLKAMELMNLKNK